jgi:hypothetical protein
MSQKRRLTDKEVEGIRAGVDGGMRGPILVKWVEQLLDDYEERERKKRTQKAKRGPSILRLTPAREERLVVEEDLNGGQYLLRVLREREHSPLLEFRWSLTACLALARSAETKLRRIHGEQAWEAWLQVEQATLQTAEEDRIVLTVMKETRDASLHDNLHPLQTALIYRNSERHVVAIVRMGWRVKYRPCGSASGI